MTQVFRFKLSENLKIPRTSTRESPRCLETLAKSVVDQLPLPSLFSWSINDVSLWIENLGFPEYTNVFEQNFIDGRKLIRIDSSCLVHMKIQNFDHIKKITAGIRTLYNIEPAKLPQNLSRLPMQPETMFKIHKSFTGRKYDEMTRSEFFKLLKCVTDDENFDMNHFERLHQKFKFIPYHQSVRVGRTLSEMNNSKLLDENRKLSIIQNCALSGTELFKWPERELRAPWRLCLLTKLQNQASNSIQSP